MKKLLIISFFGLMLLLHPSLLLAQDTSTTTDSTPTEIQAPSDSGEKLYNPIRAFGNPEKGITDPREILGRVVQVLIGFSGSLALLMFLYGGILFLTSGGKADLAQKGLHVIVWAILGILLIAAAYVATNTVFKALLTGNAVGTGN